jgi:formylglycine-generating enzyme required for sulfatase activity
MRHRICLLLMIELLVGIHQALGQITNLGIASAGNQSVLFWPTTLPNYVLQSTTNLASPNWVTVSNAVPANAVCVTNASPANFFRLIQSTTSDGMAFIPAGAFTMGDSLDGESDASPTVTVYVSAFYMDTNLVSYSQWQSVYNWATNHGYGFDHVGSGKAANHPVQTVDWYDAVKWSNARSQQAGLTPVYFTDAGLTQIYTNGDVAPYVNWTNSGYRLPTEAEWEKSARGGLSGQRFPWGNVVSESLANYIGNTNSYSYDLGPNGYNAIGSVGGNSPATSPVGSFAPNGYGLYDMAGNVFEWCWDWYGTPYAGGSDPHGSATGSIRVLRGGSEGNDAYQARCAFRNNISIGPSDLSIRFGFRCVRRF